MPRELKIRRGSKPWHRQDGESVQAYEAFMTYLTMGDVRSLRKTAQVLPKNMSLIAKWNGKWAWNQRVAAYEEHFQLLRLETLEAEREAMWLRHRSLANEAMSLVESTFAGLRAKIDEEGKLNEIKPDALVRLMAEAAKLDRMAVLGRIEAHAKTSEERERLIERYADELSVLLKELMGEAELTPEQEQKFQDAVERHLFEDGELAADRALAGE